MVVETFTREFGRVAVVARGAKRPTSQFRGLLSPFNPIALSWSGRNEIKTLVRAEWLGGMQPLRGDSLLAAFYANELLVRLLARGDAHPQTFGSYVELLRSLTRNARHDAALRTFELDLLAGHRLCDAARSLHRRQRNRRTSTICIRGRAGCPAHRCECRQRIRRRHASAVAR